MILIIELLLFRFLNFFKSPLFGSRNVLILKFDGLGDLTILLNSLKNLEKPNDFGDFILVTKSSFNEIAKSSGLFDQVIIVEEELFRRRFAYRRNIYKRLRKLNPLQIVNPVYSNIVNSFSDLIVAAVFPPKRSLSPTYTSSSLGGKILRRLKEGVYNDRIYFDISNTHELLYNTTFFKSLGFKLKNGDSGTFPYYSLKNRARSSKIIIAPGSNNPIKNWEKSKFLDLAILLSKLDYEILFVGTSIDLAHLEIPSHVNSRIKIVDNLTDLCELFKLINSAIFVVSNDSSVGHIAEYMRVPYVVISWGVFKGRYFPYPNSSVPSKIVYFGECIGCNEFCINQSNRASCLNNISVYQVYKEVLQLLNLK